MLLQLKWVDKNGDFWIIISLIELLSTVDTEKLKIQLNKKKLTKIVQKYLISSTSNVLRCLTVDQQFATDQRLELTIYLAVARCRSLFQIHSKFLAQKKREISPMVSFRSRELSDSKNEVTHWMDHYYYLGPHQTLVHTRMHILCIFKFEIISIYSLLGRSTNKSHSKICRTMSCDDKEIPSTKFAWPKTIR